MSYTNQIFKNSLGPHWFFCKSRQVVEADRLKEISRIQIFNEINYQNFILFCRLDWHQKLHHNILIQNLKCCAPHQSEFFKMSFFPWSKKDKKSKEKKGGSVAASSSVVASSPASASSNEISKFILNFKTSCLSNRNRFQ